MCSIFAEAIKEGKWNVCDTMQNNIFFQASVTPDDYQYYFPGQYFYEVFWKNVDGNNHSSSKKIKVNKLKRYNLNKTLIGGSIHGSSSSNYNDCSQDFNNGNSIKNQNQLHGIHFVVNPQYLSSKGVVLCFHGNAGTIAQWGLLANIFTKRGYDLLMIDYRTFGKSKGELTEEVLHFDAMIAYEYLKKYYKSDKIYIHGISIGTAIAIKLASQVECRAVVLQTPFYNLRDVEQAHVRLPDFVCRLFKFQFESDSYVTKIKCPIYAIHSQDDTLIPYSSAVKLFQKLKHRKDCVLWIVDNVGHSVELSNYYPKFLDSIYH